MAGVLPVNRASRGIGAATALVAGRRDYRVCVNYRRNHATADAAALRNSAAALRNSAAAPRSIRAERGDG